MSWSRQAGIVLPGYNPLLVANAPTIGTATAGLAQCASVAFTAPACVGGGAISSYTVFANCGALRATGASSPLLVTGLTVGTSYTFKAVATNAYGPSYPSAASNSVTGAVATCAVYTTAGTFSWVAPTGVTSVAVVAVGSGGYGYNGSGAGGGGGGALVYRNAVSVTPGSSYTVVVGATGSSSSVLSAVAGGGTNNTGGSACSSIAAGAPSGTYTAGFSGGTGWLGRGCSGYPGGGGGAAGYSAAGGQGGSLGRTITASTGGGGGGGWGGAGGGVGLYGAGANGAAATSPNNGAGGAGSGGFRANGTQGCAPSTGYAGGRYGGGSGYGSTSTGGIGAVRIVWCVGGARGTPSFPSTNVGP